MKAAMARIASRPAICDSFSPLSSCTGSTDVPCAVVMERSASCLAPPCLPGRAERNWRPHRDELPGRGRNDTGCDTLRDEKYSFRASRTGPTAEVQPPRLRVIDSDRFYIHQDPSSTDSGAHDLLRPRGDDHFPCNPGEEFIPHQNCELRLAFLSGPATAIRCSGRGPL